MPVAIIFALYILQANNAVVPTPIWVLAWVILVLATIAVITETIDKSSAKEQRKTIIALLTSIKRSK